MSKSKLVRELNIETREELIELTKNSKIELRKIAYSVIFKNMSYEKAGAEFNTSRHAVYEFLKRLYQKKYGHPYRGE